MTVTQHFLLVVNVMTSIPRDTCDNKNHSEQTFRLVNLRLIVAVNIGLHTVTVVVVTVFVVKCSLKALFAHIYV